MKSKKIYIVLLIILVIFCIIMFSLFGVENVKQKNYKSTIILGENTVWTYRNKKWNYINNISDFNKLSWQEYNVYFDNKSIGRYYLWHDDKWYVFDKDKKAVEIDGNLFAYDANFNMNIYDFNLEKIRDRTYVDKALNENDISISSSFTTSNKVSFDFDGDNVDEDFYLVSNAFPIEFNPDYIFSLVFMVKNNEIYYLYRDIAPNNSFNGCKPFFNTILDTNNDGLYEIILSCGRYSDLGQLDMLYSFVDNNEFKILISNQ